jgi:Ca2+-dependent lipid-binding protein
MMDNTIYDIKPKPQEDYEVRVVIYDTRNIKMMDVEGTSDVYVKAFFDSKHAKETDTHYRCTDGKASFNYRLLFNVQHPVKDKSSYMLNLQIFDRDFFKSNDVIGDATLDLKPLMEDVTLTKRPLTLNRSYYDGYYKDKTGTNVEFKNDSSFWIDINSYDAA